MIKFVIVFVLVWLLFFLIKNMRRANNTKHNTKNSNKSNNNMIICANCQTHIPENEALLKGGKTYCSKACL